MSTWLCPKCEHEFEMDSYEVRGDDGTVAAYSIVTEPCACMALCCSECSTPLDDTGHCENVGCWAFTLIIPIPIEAPARMAQKIQIIPRPLRSDPGRKERR